MSGSGKGSEGNVQGKERREDVCVVSDGGYLIRELRSEEGARQTLGRRRFRQRWQWVGRAWGGGVSGFFKELVLVGLEQRALGRMIEGKAGRKQRSPSGLWIRGICMWKCTVDPWTAGEWSVNTPTAWPMHLKITFCYLCLKKTMGWEVEWGRRIDK